MIVVVTGGEGTGKTILARSLAERLGIELLPSLKEPTLDASGYHTLFEWDAATGGLEALVEAQTEREERLESGVIDGPSVELFAISQRWIGHRLSPVRAERLWARVERSMVRYDTVVLTPDRVVAGPARGRFRSLEHNKQLARLLRSALVEGGRGKLARIDVADAPEAERLAQALAVTSR